MSPIFAVDFIEINSTTALNGKSIKCISNWWSIDFNFMF